MTITSQHIIKELFEFLKTDYDFKGPESFNVAYENHLTYSNDKFKIDFSDEGDWDFPNITIKDYKGNFKQIPHRWFKPEGLQTKIARDYRKPRNLRWLSKVDPKTLDSSSYPLTKEVIENTDDSFHERGHKIVAIYLLIAAEILKLKMDEIPSLFENRILKRIKNYLQQNL
jgi:hypothetical protein